MPPPIVGQWRRLQLQLAASALLGGVITALLRTAFGMELPAAAAFALPLAIITAPLSFSAAYLCRALPLSRTPPLRLAMAVAAAAAVSGGVWAVAGLGWWDGLARLGVATPNLPITALAALLVGFGALGYVLSVSVHYLLQAFEESAAASRQILASEVAHRDAELRALRAQIDPHFLFNSLNSISALTTSDPARAREMCQLLAEFLRETLAVGGSVRIPLRREIGLAEQYLRVEQVRFGRRLDVRASVAADSAELPVPPLILQPLVENAVRHGIATCLAGGTIEIDTHRNGSRAVIDIRNPREPDAARPGTGRGLDLVRRRLAATFGGRAGLSVDARPDTYRVSLSLPIGDDAP